MIACHECGHPLTEKESSCPECGCPVEIQFRKTASGFEISSFASTHETWKAVCDLLGEKAQYADYQQSFIGANNLEIRDSHENIIVEYSGKNLQNKKVWEVVQTVIEDDWSSVNRQPNILSCHECGHPLTEKESSCPECGCPKSFISDQVTRTNKASETESDPAKLARKNEIDNEIIDPLAKTDVAKVESKSTSKESHNARKDKTSIKNINVSDQSITESKDNSREFSHSARNFCSKCGAKVTTKTNFCTQCGFEFNSAARISRKVYDKGRYSIKSIKFFDDKYLNLIIVIVLLILGIAGAPILIPIVLAFWIIKSILSNFNN